MDRTGEDDVLAKKAVDLAAHWLARSVRRGVTEQRRTRRVARLLDDKEGLSFVLALTDEVLRIRDPKRAAGHFRRLVKSSGIPMFMGPLDRVSARLGSFLSGLFPRVVMPLVLARVRAELSRYVVPADPSRLGRHIARRRDQGFRLNINVLGEAVLGDDEARLRLEAVIALLERSDVDYVSVKISAICSQLDVADFDHGVEKVAGRLRRLYDEALRYEPPKFVNLDMEEYRDLAMTVAVFQQVLSEARYGNLNAGIVLQAYIPDSLAVLRELCPWARARHQRYGGSIKVRLVKGANLAKERVDAELAGWAQAPYQTKAEVDANYKRMLDAVLDPVNAGALRVGVASHNLFEVAWALVISEDRNLRPMVDVEMLEGMAPAAAEQVRQSVGDLVLYAPIARKSDPESVIAYLVRRFDENSGPENFLRHQFSIEVGSPWWNEERDRFRQAVIDRRRPTVRTRRDQDRRGGEQAPRQTDAFTNDPDTDFTQEGNRRWMQENLRSTSEQTSVVPAMVGGRRVVEPLSGEGIDPAMPGVVRYRWVQCDVALVNEAVAAAKSAGSDWRRSSWQQRRELLEAVGDSLSSARGRLIGLMIHDGGKNFREADSEVSEAIDFARYYASSTVRIETLERQGARFEPLGSIVVVPPWNFPLSIPAGGVLAALAAGNAAILKPAPETVATGWALAELCWAAGVPPELLQFVPCADDDAGCRLVSHPDVDAVILTGSWDTARLFLGWRPSLRLHAETSGKNAIVVTATADLDLAIDDIVTSAFTHSGQKCSAASLAIVEASVYDDPRFIRRLGDAVRTLQVGSGSDPGTIVNPLIRAPEGALSNALRHLGAGESWLVEPRQASPNAQLWSPGVKLGVRPGSSFHLTECFGPVLGLMRWESFEEAIAWQNQTPYGLTAGLHSLDPAEITQWRDHVRAGNLYVNRTITGAIVGRQPFGGWKRSMVGPGAKVGGPNYVSSLGTWSSTSPLVSPGEFALKAALLWHHEMAPTDPSALRAEANVFRYRPLQNVLLRVGPHLSNDHVRLVLIAANTIGANVEISSPMALPGFGAVTVESEAALADRISAIGFDKLRLLGRSSDELRLAAHDAALWVDDLPLVGDPSLELLRWVREQSVSETLHRHGNVTGHYQGPLNLGALETSYRTAPNDSLK
jgi:RHH-type transcriptional regulator, proline utilization regulon repressor / proline dehydrogenase / delta 1-pyrroline-5-carboxylate dehydrogenase